MPDYRIICTALPRGLYEQGKLRLTLLLHLQYTGDANVPLSSLDLYRNWTGKLKSSATGNVEIKFFQPGDQPASQPTPLLNAPLQVKLPLGLLRPDIWDTLLPGDTIVRCAKCEPPPPPEFQSYSQADTAKDLQKRTIDAATGATSRSPQLHLSTFAALDPTTSDYPSFPSRDQLDAAYEVVSPFLKSVHCATQKPLVSNMLMTLGPARNPISRDLERLQRLNPNAAIKPEALQALVSIHSDQQLDFARLDPSLRLSTIEHDTDQEMRVEYTKALVFHRPIDHEIHSAHATELAPLDFNQRLAVFGHSPAFLRPLGLAFDLEVLLTGDQQQRFEGPGRRLVAASIENLIPNLPEVTFPTCYTAYKIHPMGGKRYFIAAGRKDEPGQPNAPLHCDGMLDLSEPDRYALISSEPAGAILRIAQSVSTEPIKNDDAATIKDDLPGESPHHLRSGGLALVMQEREKHAGNDMVRAADAATKSIFFSEDLHLGYRVDVQRYRLAEGQTQPRIDKWRSLCQRTSVYEIRDPNKSTAAVNEPAKLTWVPDKADAIVNEGFIQTSYVRAPDAAPSEYQANSALFRWENWSLGARFPLDAKSVPECDKLEPTTAPQQTGLNVVHNVLEHSLPKLEFGDGYSVRLRAVDLAGNSFCLEEAPQDGPCVLGPHRHQRFEPVGVPEVLLAKAYHATESPGEQTTHLVIRGLGTSTSFDVSQRFIVPPRVTQTFAEMHGVAELFDPARGAFFDPELNPQGPYLALRHDGTFIRACDVWRECEDNEDCKRKEDEKNPDANNAVYKFTTERSPVKNSNFFPDPAARFARLLLRGPDPGGAPLGPSKEFDFYKAERWPNVIPFGVQLQAAGSGQSEPAKMEWLRSADPLSRKRGDGAGDILAIHLQPSHTAHLIVHCLPDLKATDLRQTAPLTSMSILSAPAQKSAASFAFAEALSTTLNTLNITSSPSVNLFHHWLLSSPLVLKFVHAVEKPLQAPAFTSLAIAYQIDPATQKPQLGITSVELSGNMQCHRRSTGRLEVLARWEEPFDDINKLDYDSTPVAHKASVYVNNLTTADSEEPNQDKPVSFDNLKHEFGDTKYREVMYGIEASSRFKEYYPPSTNDERRFAVTSTAEKPLTVLNRARPALAVSKGVMPAFRWKTTPGDGRHSVIRERQCLVRVWIERPWFSSGAHEKLAVLLSPQGNQSAACKPEVIESFTSLWGVDPLWASPRINRPLKATDFRGNSEFANNLTIPGSDCLVDAVVYEVQYSNERHMWYADIQVDPANSYFPFVRFALARYQRNSIPNSHLSGVTLADPVQVFPTRTASAIREQKHVWGVTVKGTSFDPSPERTKVNNILFTVVERRSEDSSDAGWMVTRDEAGQSIQQLVTPTGSALFTEWKTSLRLPDRNRTRYAIMIEELENWQIDGTDPQTNQRTPNPALHGSTTRLVYVDRVEIS